MNKELQFKRGVIYSLMAYAFGEPDREFYEFVTSGELVGVIEETQFPGAVAQSLKTADIWRAAAEAAEIGFDELAGIYGSLVSPKINYLYECNYHSSFSSFNEMADVAGFYKAFGAGFTGERPDHLSMELEFMNMLIAKEIKATGAGETLNAEVCSKGQMDFLASHPGRWVDGLALAAKDLKYYGGMASFLREWIEKDCEYLRVKPENKLYELYGEPQYGTEGTEMECEAANMGS